MAAAGAQCHLVVCTCYFYRGSFLQGNLLCVRKRKWVPGTEAILCVCEANDTHSINLFHCRDPIDLASFFFFFVLFKSS